MGGWLTRLRSLFNPSRGDRPVLGSAAFRLKYERFRELLSLNDAALQLYADLEDMLASSEAFALDSTLQRTRKAALDVFVMVKNLNQIAGGQYHDLYDAMQRISGQLDAEFLRLRGAAQGPLVVPLARLRASDVPAAGAKMANLGEVASRCGLAVPEGFVISTAAFSRFMAENELWERCERLEGVLETHGPEVLAEACAEVHEAILAAALPQELEAAIEDTFERTFGEEEVLVAMRSSAVGEDAVAASHAGIYYSQLNVPRGEVAAEYRRVIASAFSPVAVAYRLERGLTAGESAMAVGCLRMVEPRAAGIMFSRHPEDLDRDEVMIAATSGVAAGVAAGTEGGSVWTGTLGGRFEGEGTLLSQEDLLRLAAAARTLEAHFRSPQDVEWAIDRGGRLVILQTRPMVPVACEIVENSTLTEGLPLLLEGGAVACPGLGGGPAVVVAGEDDLRGFPSGGVLVARHSSPKFLQVMNRCSAIVTEVGSPTGHMAILAREMGVPALVGVAGALTALAEGEAVTVDARARRIFAGLPADGKAGRRRRPGRADSPAVRALRRIAALVTPLHLTDPAAPEFSPAHCRTLHDITRFVHEKAFEVMFHFGDAAGEDRHNSYRLAAELPIEIRVFDVGGGLAEETYVGHTVPVSAVTSVPMRAFLDGMLDPRHAWRHPRPVSVKGFLSVLGESMAGPPPQAQKLGRLSYAIISDRYLNFSTKAGYHFSTVDSYCGRSTNKNYIHFRFSGGAADAQRRARRIVFLTKVLEALEFRVKAKGEILHARLDKYEEEIIVARLEDLGRITMCARQLDMLMDSDSSPEFFARAFLAGELDKFY
ncbi:MAG: hypothetical protein HRF46_15295 [Acidobacteriota bacterium]|jgi:pyruvate,water dikinase